MSLSAKSCETIKLTAFRLDEIEEVRPGVFRYRLGLRAAIARVGERWTAAWSRHPDERFRRPPNNWA